MSKRFNKIFKEWDNYKKDAHINDLLITKGRTANYQLPSYYITIMMANKVYVLGIIFGDVDDIFTLGDYSSGNRDSLRHLIVIRTNKPYTHYETFEKLRFMLEEHFKEPWDVLLQ
jgi:hypothetical protein